MENTQHWYGEKHESAWSRVKEAMKRDWEQTKADLSGHKKGKELDQDVDDTVKQAFGKEAIPPANVPNAPDAPSHLVHGREKTGANTFDDDYRNAYRDDLAWDEVEGPMAFGYGAREQYGMQYAQWDDRLEDQLRTDWETRDTAGEKTRRGWNDVKSWVRMGFDRARTH